MGGAPVYGTITVTGRVKTNFAAITSKLGALPALRCLSSGTMARYKLIGKQDETLSVSQNRISIRYVHDDGAKSRGAALSKLLTVAMFLRDDYDIDFGSAYQDVVEALLCCSGLGGRQDMVRIERLERQLEALTIANFNLSNEAIGLERESRLKDAELEVCRKVGFKVVEYCDRAVAGSSRVERVGAVIGSELARKVCEPVSSSTPFVGKMIPWKRIMH